MIDEKLAAEIYENSHGLEITGLFGNVAAFIAVTFPKPNFEQHKQAFFEILQNFLKEGKIAFKLNSHVKEYVEQKQKKEGRETLWDAPSNEIVQYIQNIFPSQITDEDDIELLIFFLSECPQMVWIYGGKWVGNGGQWIDVKACNAHSPQSHAS
jgi:hypothetical protein